jgi:hypothetical protein
LILNEIKPDIILPQVSIFRQKSLIRYIRYSIGYQIHEYLLFIGLDEEEVIVYDKKYLLKNLNYRKIIYQLLSYNVRNVLICQNITNYKFVKAKENTDQSLESQFNDVFINDLESILDFSCIKLIDYVILVKDKIYSYSTKKQYLIN